MAKLHIAFIGLGSNLGARERNIAAALAALESTRGVEVARLSSLFESAAVGGPPGQDPYLNAVAEVRTRLAATRLLKVCQEIETSLGRTRAGRWAARTIDLDILLFDAEIIATPELTVPHPLMHERLFVMEPLAEIAPDVIHPVLEQSAREILQDLIAGAAGG